MTAYGGSRFPGDEVPTEAGFGEHHRRHLVREWRQLGSFGRLAAHGQHNKRRGILLIETRCRAHEDGVAVERHQVRIDPERPLRERWRVLATLPAAGLEEWYAAPRHDDDALFDELGRLSLVVPWLPGAPAIYVDKMGRITASME